MKSVLLCIVLAACVMVAGCGNEAAPDSVSRAVGGSDMEVAEDNAGEEQSRESDPETESEGTVQGGGGSTVLEGYKKEYGASDIYQDIFIPWKYLLISENDVVLLLILNDYERTTTVSLDQIARVETKRIDDYRVIEIVDKTGRSISLSVEPGAADEISALIGK